MLESYQPETVHSVNLEQYTHRTTFRQAKVSEVVGTIENYKTMRGPMLDRLSTSGLTLSGLSTGAFACSQFVSGQRPQRDLAGFDTVIGHIAGFIEKGLALYIYIYI